MTSLGFSVLTRRVPRPADAPQNLHDLHSQIPGTAAVGWDPIPGRHGYMVQYATDPANVATYSDPTMVTKKTYKLTGQTRGSTLHVRVLALDPKLPGGKSEYSPWIAVVVAA